MNTTIVSSITAASMALASAGLPALARAQSLSTQRNVLIHPRHAVGIRAHHHRVAVVETPVVYTLHHAVGGGPAVVITRHHHHYHHRYYY
jgi:hypothetical protein